MNIKVAVISPRNFIENILVVGKTFSSLEMFPYSYENIAETVDIVQRCKDQVDVLFFRRADPLSNGRCPCG